MMAIATAAAAATKITGAPSVLWFSGSGFVGFVSGTDAGGCVNVASTSLARIVVPVAAESAVAITLVSCNCSCTPLTTVPVSYTHLTLPTKAQV